MKLETKQRIEAYKSILPGMKERIAGAALMFVIAIVMVVSSTFAWVTLSSNPEIKDINTSVSGNGSLEIALANGSGKNLPTSGRADSSAVDSDLLRANITWGNLVNLSDPQYGISSITLRPASLTGATGLLSNPLFGVSYGADGRVIKTTSEDDFAYCFFDSEHETFNADLASNHYGVRAVSTVTYTNLQGDTVLGELKRNVDRTLNSAKTAYARMTDKSQEPGKGYINSIQGLIQVYAQAQIDGNLNNTPITDYVPDLYNMLTYLDENVVKQLEETYLNLAGICYLKENGNIDNFNNEFNIDSLCSKAISDTLPNYISNDLTSLKQFATDRKTLRNYLNASNNTSLAHYAELANSGTTVYWKNIQGVVNWVIDINTCTLDGYNMNQISGFGTAMSILGNSSHKAVANGGALYRMELRIGQYMSPTVTVTVDPSGLGGLAALAGQKTITAPITTKAKEQQQDIVEVTQDRDSALAGAGNYKGTDAIAEDTYALAIDLWVRTNAGAAYGTEDTENNYTDSEGNNVKEIISGEKAYLTLEGNFKYQTYLVDDTVKVNGIEYPLYTASYNNSGEVISYDVYKKDDRYFTVENHIPVDELLADYGLTIDNIDIVQKPQIPKTVVIDYDGVNRIWPEDEMEGFKVIGGTSTTQGNGSCYTFYADNEADQSRFLQLLKAVKVVFINDQGRMIGRADMDTDNFFAENGKVTVPLVLDKSSAMNLGNGKFGLMSLQKNVATRVTALIYLDGTTLTNTMVLAGNDIQGSLNVQFGSTTASVVTKTTEYTDEETGEPFYHTDVIYTQPGDLDPADNSLLKDDYVAVRGTIGANEFDFDENNLPKTTVNVEVEGTTPNSVAARFTRVINSTQGVVQQIQPLTYNASTGKWTGEYTFNNPGNYVARTVFVDGVEYDLPNALSVTIRGLTVRSLSSDAISEGRSTTILTANTRFSTKILLGFSTSDKQPKTLRGIFLDENGRQVTVVFSHQGSGNWAGNAQFSSSGSYTMRYIEINREQYEIEQNLQLTLDIKLGLKVRTWITASAETLAKLQAIDENATATRFTLDTNKTDDEGNILLNITGDPGDDVTLLVSAKILDNSGLEIAGLRGAKLVYGKVGSSIKRLDSDMEWNSSTGRYEGEFLVTEAGNYRFNNMTVGSNIITSFTVAPNVQVVPPEPAYYYGNFTTESYIFAPDGDAKITLGIAYSNAATQITAVFEDENGNTYETDGVLGYEAENTGDVSVNLWDFTIPKLNGTQDGRWKINAIKMYGVYYKVDNQDVYFDEETPAEIDLTGENINVKVVNTIYTTLRGTSDEYSGFYLADHNTNFTFTILDFEGLPLQNISVTDVDLTYYLDTSANSSDYGYTSASGLGDYKVSGTGTDKGNGTYSTTLNFIVAGYYHNADVSITVGGRKYNASQMHMNYYDGANLSENAPKYAVTWTAPTIKITGSNPAKGSSFDINLASGSSLNAVTVQNYYEDYYANVYAKVSTLFGYATGYTLPTLTFTISDAGSKLSSSNSAIFRVPNPAYTKYEAKVATFTSNNSSKTLEIGDMDGNTRQLAGTIKINTIEMRYGNMYFVMPLSHEILIKETNAAPNTVTFVVPNEYASQVSTPAADKTNKGTITLPTPSKTQWTETDEVPGEMSPETATSATRNVYTKVTTGSGCNASTTYTNYSRVTKTYTSSGIAETRRITYRVKGWKVGSNLYQPGDTITYTANTTVTLEVEIVSSELISSKTSTRTRITYKDTKTGTSTSSGTGTQVSTVYTTETTISDTYN